MLPRNFISESEKRKRQIDTLKIFNDNVLEIIENAEYRIEFTAGQHKMYLEVVLCPEFPYEKPIMMVKPHIIHPWVADNSCNIIGAPGLLNYTIHSDLGRVVQAIIREFKHKPPKLLDEIPIQNGIDTNINNNPGSMLCGMVSSPTFAVNSPVRPVSFPEIESLSIEELIDIKDSDDHADKFIENLPPFIESNNSITELMDNIEQIANDNLSKESSLEELRKDIMDKIECINQLKLSYEALKTQHEKLSSMYTPHAIMMKLGASTIAADEESERIAESFLQGDMDCDTFLKSYRIQRSLGHSRRACQERLSHQLSQFDKAG